METGKIMAIDYGTAKIGLAVTDVNRLMAFGRGVWRFESRGKAIEAIGGMVMEEQVVKVVIGLPMAVDAGETAQTLKIRGFGGELEVFLKEKGCDVGIEYIDESFSSFEAGRILEEIGATREQKRETEDEMAAVILLHRYIDFRP